MNASVLWTAVGAIAAVAGVGGILLFHMVRYAYAQGRTDHRLEAMEAQVEQHGGIASTIAALTSTVEALRESVNRLDRAVERMAGHPPPRHPIGDHA